MFSLRFICAFLYCCFINVIYSEVYIKTTKLECSTNPKYIINHTCRLKPINRYKALTFMEGHIKDKLRNVSVNVGLYARNDANIYRPFLINFTVNFCQFMDRRVSGLYANLFVKLLAKFSNMNHTCPYTGSAIVKDGYLDRSFIPVATIPKNTYKCVVVFYEGYPLDYFGTAAFYLEIVESKP